MLASSVFISSMLGATLDASPDASSSADAVWLTTGNTSGPVLHVADGSPPVHLHRVSVRGQVIINGSSATQLFVDGCSFDGLSANADGVEFGGGLRVIGGRIRVAGSTFRRLHARRGGVLALTSESADRPAVAFVTRSTLAESSADLGGAVYVDGGSLELRGQVVLRDNSADEGGGLYARRGDIFLVDETKLLDNQALSGANYLVADPSAVDLFYILPAPPAHYVTQTSLCPTTKPAEVAAECPPEASTYPQLRNATFARLSLPVMRADFPYACSAGLYGRPRIIADQVAIDCYARCPAGYECPKGTAEPIPCEPGTYCEEGTGVATRCQVKPLVVPNSCATPLPRVSSAHP